MWFEGTSEESFDETFLDGALVGASFRVSGGFIPGYVHVHKRASVHFVILGGSHP
jgi:hypothetical protein